MRVASPGQSLESLVATTVRAVLESASLKPDAIDAVVALGNEQVDGGISPLLMAEAACGLGRSYLFVTGSSGDALHSGLSLVRSRMASIALVVGWSQSTRLSFDDVAAISTDPLFHQPLGLGAAGLAAMHSAQLAWDRLIDLRELGRYAETMRARRRSDRSLQGARIVRSGASSTAAGRRRRHAGPDRVDRATAILLSPSGSSTRISGFATTRRDLVPADDDPAVWLGETLRLLDDGGSKPIARGTVVEIGSPAPHAEFRALHALGLGDEWATRPGFNRHGGGFAAYGGAADGLARVASVFEAVEPNGAGRSEGIAIEMSGPLGQSISAIRLVADVG